jgi:hypothetical protein
VRADTDADAFSVSLAITLAFADEDAHSCAHPGADANSELYP